MSLLNKLRNRFRNTARLIETDPEEAYNIWSQNYDVQPGNLMLALDEEVFTNCLNKVAIHNRTVVDVGCGTGRHWNKILLLKPLKLMGYDVSAGMLEKLRGKYPQSSVFKLNDNHLPGLKNESCDIVISTLTIAHIAHVAEAFEEWARVLKRGAHVIVTDYHPQALLQGADRTFVSGGKTFTVKNYIHPLDRILATVENLGFELLYFEEKKIDNSVRSYYEQKKALHVFNAFKDVPIIYGMLLRKKDAAS